MSEFSCFLVLLCVIVGCSAENLILLLFVRQEELVFVSICFDLITVSRSGAPQTCLEFIPDKHLACPTTEARKCAWKRAPSGALFLQYLGRL